MRPNCRYFWRPFDPQLPRKAPPHRISRSRNRQGLHLPDQQLRPAAPTIARLCKCRWQVERFFKWIKQHPRIKRLFNGTESAVKTQVWIAVSIYVLVAILKKRLDIDASPDTILQVLSVTVFEKTPLLQILSEAEPEEKSPPRHAKLKPFEKQPCSSGTVSFFPFLLA